MLTGADVDLGARDPAFLRANLPLWWLLATVYHRAEVDGFEHVPDTPMMFVGNHSGGSMTPDAFLFLLFYQTYFSVDRPVHALAHAFVTSVPLLGDWFGHIPLPTKVRVRIGDPIDLRQRYGDRLDVDNAYAYVRSSMQMQLSRLAAERVLPPFR